MPEASFVSSIACHGTHETRSCTPWSGLPARLPACLPAQFKFGIQSHSANLAQAPERSGIASRIQAHTDRHEHSPKGTTAKKRRGGAGRLASRRTTFEQRVRWPALLIKTINPALPSYHHHNLALHFHSLQSSGEGSEGRSRISFGSPSRDAPSGPDTFFNIASLS